MSAKNTMQFIRCLSVSFAGFFSRIKKAKIIVFPICLNMGLPTIAYFMPRNTLKTRHISDWLFNIFHIFSSISYAKIKQFVVGSDPVDMVNFSIWPFIVKHSPCNSMRSQKNIIYTDNNISSAIKACNNFTGGTFSSFDAPAQQSCVRIIRQKFFEAVDFWMFHTGNMATSVYLVNHRRLLSHP